VLVVEEHNTEGGLGTMVAEALALRGLRVPVLKHGIPDEYCIIGPPAQCYAYYGLDEDGIRAVASRFADKAGAWWDGVDRACWTDDDRRGVLAAARSNDRTPPNLSLVGLDS
jgi:transketolase